MPKINITHIGETELRYRFKELVGDEIASLPDPYNKLKPIYDKTFENACEAAENGNRAMMETQLNDLKIYHLIMQKSVDIGSLWGVFRQVMRHLPKDTDIKYNFIPPFGKYAENLEDGKR